MTQVSRRHHYSPKSFLAGFKDRGHVKGNIWEFDAETGRRSKGLPKRVAWQHDFYSINLPNQPPDLVENLFSRIESHSAPILKKLIDTKQIPSGKEFRDLMLFLALMFGRGPTWRRILLDMLTAHETEVVKMSLSMPGVAERFFNSLKKSGRISMDADFEDVAKGVLAEEFQLRISNQSESHAKIVTESLSFLPQMLGRRNWGIINVDNPDNFFITSDSCSSLVWIEPEMYRFGPPGLEPVMYFRAQTRWGGPVST